MIGPTLRSPAWDDDHREPYAVTATMPMEELFAWLEIDPDILSPANAESEARIWLQDQRDAGVEEPYTLLCTPGDSNGLRQCIEENTLSWRTPISERFAIDLNTLSPVLVRNPRGPNLFPLNSHLFAVDTEPHAEGIELVHDLVAACGSEPSGYHGWPPRYPIGPWGTECRHDARIDGLAVDLRTNGDVMPIWRELHDALADVFDQWRRDGEAAPAIVDPEGESDGRRHAPFRAAQQEGLVFSIGDIRLRAGAEWFAHGIGATHADDGTNNALAGLYQTLPQEEMLGVLGLDVDLGPYAHIATRAELRVEPAERDPLPYLTTLLCSTDEIDGLRRCLFPERNESSAEWLDIDVATLVPTPVRHRLGAGSMGRPVYGVLERATDDGQGSEFVMVASCSIQATPQTRYLRPDDLEPFGRECTYVHWADGIRYMLRADAGAMSHWREMRAGLVTLVDQARLEGLAAPTLHEDAGARRQDCLARLRALAAEQSVLERLGEIAVTAILLRSPAQPPHFGIRECRRPADGR